MLPYLFYILVVPTIGLYDFAMRFTVHAVKGQKLRPENFLPLFELATIHIIQNNFGNGQGDGFYSSTTLWLTMHVTCSAWIITIGTTAAHHHPDIYRAGDDPRGQDWGIYQLDATRDVDGKASIYWLKMTTYGDHQLHHLFPTVDHSKLPLLYP